MKLRKKARYFVAESNDRFHRLIRHVYHYAGRHPYNGKMMHLFLSVGDSNSGLWIDDDLTGVEVYNAERVQEIDAIANYYLETDRVPNNKTIQRLLGR